MEIGDSTNSNNNINTLEENLRLSVEEHSYHHHHNPPHPQDVSTFENGLDIIHPQQHLGLNLENSYNNNNNTGIPFEQSTWNSRMQELQDVLFANNQEQQQQPHDLQFQHSDGFLGHHAIGSSGNTSASSTVFHDPMFHLNLPPHSQSFRELFQSISQGYSCLPTSPSNGFLFSGGDEAERKGGAYQEGDGSQLDAGILEFNSVAASVAKGKKGKDVKHFAYEKQRRDQWNGKYEVLRSLIPNPTKADRASVVGDAIEYIRELIRTVNELKLLVEKKRYGKERSKRQKTEDDAAESCNIKPFGDQDGSIRTSWLQRKSKDSEVDVRIIDDQVTIKVFQRKKINCLLFVSKVLDELRLDLNHVAGGHVGEYCSFLFNSKIIEGSSVYASAIANKVIEVIDNEYAAAVPNTSSY
ncbi:hypothetical protein RIF29_04075 [Crotalaria pallida]|uniref:BHLH domain-containing protein n=1 Tax=Crotalaria pallida TaxID=3830 RepID=A0AAN9J0N6_CROPI